MAKRGVNKSAAIRDMIGQNPKAKASEIISLLADKGIKVRPHLVYLVKGKMKRIKRRQKRQRVMAMARNGNPVELILKVKELARDAGGIGSLKQIVDGHESIDFPSARASWSATAAKGTVDILLPLAFPRRCLAVQLVAVDAKV